MKHIVFVLGSYYPRYSAVGVCAERVVNALKGEFKISVIAMADQHAVESLVNLDGVDIFRVTTPEIAERIRLEQRLRSSSTFPDRLRLLGLRARATLRRLLSPVTINQQLVDAYKEKLRDIPGLDVIVPLVFPYESVIAAIEYASASNVMVVPYIFDNFVDSRSLHVLDIARKIKKKRHLELEADMLEKSAAVLAMHPLRAHFRKYFGNVADEKIHFLEHPLLAPKSRVNADTGDTIRMVYTGALVKNVRDAAYVLELLTQLRMDVQVDADFYVMGSAASEVQTRTTDFGVRIRNNGQVDKKVADAAVAHASVLLNIGEVEGKQISSKIFEYMSAGKPIIHFAYTEDDNVTKIVNRYPLALCLLQSPNKMEENRKKFSEFISTNAGRTMPFDEVAAIFPEALPGTTASLVVKIVNAFPD
jgi:glycosyltransferase involved in cell wall biosynthesis